MYLVPGVGDFKGYFIYDFPYGTTPDTVTDIRITNALQLAGFYRNDEFWPDQQSFTVGYLLLSAHFLVMNIRASSQGISGQYAWTTSSKAVGSVSEAYSIPQQILDNPFYAALTKTTYGAEWFFLVFPYLTGQMFASYGGTNP